MTVTRRARAALPLCLAAALLSACSASPGSPTASRPIVTATPAPSATAAVSPSPSATAAASPPVRVVMIGDSLMSGYGLAPADAWPELLRLATPIQVTNLACGGTGFVAIGDCGSAYDGFVPAVAALQPGIVVIESSSNDFDLTPDELADATVDTLERLRAAAPDALIVGLSTIWDDADELPDDVAGTSAALARGLEEVGGVFVDVGQPLAGHPGWMQEDGVHPTAAGQQAIAAAVRQALIETAVLG